MATGTESKPNLASLQTEAQKEDEARAAAEENAKQAQRDREAKIAETDVPDSENPALDQKRRNPNIDRAVLPEDVTVQRVADSQVNSIGVATGDYDLSNGPIQVDSVTAELLVDTGEAEVVA